MINMITKKILLDTILFEIFFIAIVVIFVVQISIWTSYTSVSIIILIFGIIFWVMGSVYFINKKSNFDIYRW